MRPGKFRFESILTVYNNREDAVKQEIAGLESEKKQLGVKAERLLLESEEAKRSLGDEDRPCDAVSILKFIEGAMHWIEEAKQQEEVLEKAILEKLDVLKELRIERMRFEKLKEKHQEEIKYYIKMQEQKVTDEFSQRKKDS